MLFRLSLSLIIISAYVVIGGSAITETQYVMTRHCIKVLEPRDDTEFISTDRKHWRSINVHVEFIPNCEQTRVVRTDE